MTKEALQVEVLATEQLLATSVTDALRVILKDKISGEQELEFLRLALSGDVSRPLLEISSLDSGFLAMAYKTVLARDSLPFPLTNTSPSQPGEPIDGLYVY